MKKTDSQADVKTNEKEVRCIDLVFKDPDGKHRHIQFNGRWIIEDKPNNDGISVSVAITEKNQFFVYHNCDPEAYYEIFASWEELLEKDNYDESILDLIWNEVKDSMLETLDI